MLGTSGRSSVPQTDPLLICGTNVLGSAESVASKSRESPTAQKLRSEACLPDEMTSGSSNLAEPDSSISSSTWVSTEVRVRYAETDQMGLVYYANYLVWFEVGRAEFCRQRGFAYRDFEQENDAYLPSPKRGADTTRRLVTTIFSSFAHA